VGRLSRQIEKNLKAPSDFRVRSDAENLPEVSEIYRSGHSAGTVFTVDRGGVQRTRQDVGVFAAPTTRTYRCSDRLGGKTTLDKYFRVTKTWRRLRDLNVGRLSVAASDGSAKSPVERPSYPEAQQITVLGNEKFLFDQRFPNRECCILFTVGVGTSISKTTWFPTICILQYCTTI